METPRTGILGRLGEKVLGWIALGLLILIGVAIWRMDPVVRTSIWQGIWRTIFWVVIVAAAPWSAKLFIHRVVEAGTNWAGVGLLAVLVAVDFGAGMLLLSGCDARIEATRAAVAKEEQQQPPHEALPVPTSSTADLVRDKLADVAEGAADMAHRAAERVRGNGNAPASAGEVQTVTAEPETPEAAPRKGHGVWFWFACLAALALAGTYNYLVTEYLAEMSGA